MSSHVTTHPPSAALLTRSGKTYWTTIRRSTSPRGTAGGRSGAAAAAARVGVGEPGIRGVPGSELRGVLHVLDRATERGACPYGTSRGPPGSPEPQSAITCASSQSASESLRLAGSGSQFTSPFASTVTNLNSTSPLGASLLSSSGSTRHVGYSPSDVSIRMPRRGSQQPSCGKLPTMYTCSPNTVFARTSKCTRTKSERVSPSPSAGLPASSSCAPNEARARARERESREDDMVTKCRLEGSTNCGLSALACEHGEEMDFRLGSARSPGRSGLARRASWAWPTSARRRERRGAR